MNLTITSVARAGLTEGSTTRQKMPSSVRRRFFIAASQSSSVLTGLSGSSPAFFQRSTLMYICWKFPCSVGMP